MTDFAETAAVVVVVAAAAATAVAGMRAVTA